MPAEYQVTARKWRPQRFDEVVGQDHITRTLKNAIRENRLAHAYLFTGQRGCGKTTVARILAKAINCPNAKKNNYEPCNECEICKSITSGNSMDVAEIDGASNNSVDDVREMRDNVKYPPLNGNYRVIIIDEVHMLSPQAFNALLKTLEEPPPHLVFIFATTEVQKVLPTILSRTQRYDFRRMQIEEIVKHLRHIADTDAITADDDSLLLIAKKADGSMRDAQSVFDQAVAFSGAKLEAVSLRDALGLIDADFYFEVTDSIREQESSKAFALATEVISRGYDIEEFIGGLLDHLRNFLTVIVTGKPQLLEVVKHHQERYAADAKSFSEGDILRLTKIGFGALERLRSAPSPRITLELMLVEMTLLERALDIRSLLDEIRALKGAANGLPSAPTASTSAASKPTVRGTSSSVKPEAVPSVEASPEVRVPIASSDIAMRWSDFVEELSTKSIPFRLISNDIELGEAAGNQIQIVVSKRHTEETFSRNRDSFTNTLREYFANPSLFFELKKVEKRNTSPIQKTDIPAPKLNGNGKASALPATVTIDDSVERTELELALIKELGAIPL
ncbi:MAG TPA: DNA polymerase III subunit gamma/tau [Candidatus Kapabacteria bacterium]|nr:DNA polymerase III subunit gamma/tau [Candidatus Kapabacteria bacterium]